MGLADVARLALAGTSEATDIATSADNAVSDILALTDIDQAAALAAGASLYNVASAQPYATRAFLFQGFLNAIKAHVANMGTYLSDNTAKVSLKFATIWRSIYGAGSLPAAVVFQDTVVIARSITFTAATTDSETPGTDLDTTLVAPALYEVECLTDIDSATSVTLTMKKLGGSAEAKVVALANTLSAGDKVAIGGGTDVYIGCTASSQTGATASNAIKVQSKVLRSAVL